MVEMLVAVGIIALLAAVFVLNAQGARSRAWEALAANHGGTMAQAIQSYLGVYVTETPSSLMARLSSRLPAADWTGAPAAARVGSQGGDRSCTGSYSLPDPSGATTRFSWPAAPSNVGCVLGLRTQGGLSRLQVITWVRGSSRWYVDGQAQ